MNWPRITLAIAGFLGATALMVGAYAAHAKGLFPHVSGILERTAMYQLIHAGLLALLAFQFRPYLRTSIVLLLSGTLAFCGAIYLRHMLQLSLPFPLAPVGGVTLMLGWLSLSVEALRHRFIP